MCEGPRQGLDERTLNAVLVQYHNLRVLVSPSGGDTSLGAVRAFLEDRSRSDVAISIEDRNHRPVAVSNSTWVNPNRKSFTWRHHEIENYLLHPRVVLNLFNALRSIPGAHWAANLPATEPDVEVLLQAIARPLLSDHAAGVFRYELIQNINQTGDVKFGVRRPPPSSGLNFPGRTEWLAALRQEAARLLQTCHLVSNLQSFQDAEIVRRYDELELQYQAPAFLLTGEFLRDMGGHELMSALHHFLRGEGAPSGYSRSLLSDDLLQALARVYAPGALFLPDDFGELAAVLAANLNAQTP